MRFMSFGGSLIILISAVACDQRVSENVDDAPKLVEVVYSGGSYEVALGEIETIAVEGVDVVRLSDVVETATLGVDLADLEFDFVASDGFRSGERSTCVDTVPMPGETLDRGYIDPVTRNLSWDAALDMPGCVRVRDAAQLLASDRELDSGSGD